MFLRLATLLLAASATASAAGCDEAEQADTCERYVACVRAIDEREGRFTNLDRFDPGGACWGRDEQAHVCEQSCEAGLAWLAERIPDPPVECSP